MRRPSALLLVLLLAAARARADDATAEFSATQNPSGPWGYGWEATPGGAFQAFASHAGPTGVSAWSATNRAALEQGCATVFQPDVTLTGAQLHARVGTGGAATVLRWTSPAAAAYHAHYFITSNLGYGFPPPGPQSVTGSQSQAEFGQVVIIAGDTNGDGFADVLVGQPHWSNGQTNEGRVLLYLGGPNGISSTPAWTWESNLAGAETGSALAAADVNGDGLMDLIVGSPGENSSAGHVDVFYSTSLGPPSTPNWTFDGAATGGRFAASLAAGDFNADGYGDFAAGSPLRNSGAGLIQFWRGGPAGLGASQRGADVSMSPPLGTGQYGATLAFVGDVDGDGYNDLVAGGPNATGPGGLTNAGAVYYFRGSVVGPSASPNVVSFGITNQHLGDAVAGVGDVDGDGHPDVIAGSSTTPNGAIPQAGAVSLLRGSAFGMQTGPTWIVWGQVANGHLGKSVAGPGDLDGDGYNDWVVGEPGWDNGTAGEGRVMVFRGAVNPATTPAWQLDSNQLNAAQGTALGAGPPGGGDVNGDGTPDFVLGTPLWDTLTTDAGRVTLVMNAGPPPVAPQKLRATLRSTLGVLATGTLDTSTGADTLTFDLDVSPAAGVPLDLELTDTDGNVVRDVVSVDAIVAPTGPPGQAFGPAYPLAGRRYAQRLGPPAFDAAAFDPLARTFASNGHVYDVCGDLLAPGPSGAGIAWDPVTRAFWSIAYDAGNARWVVSSWDTTSHTSTPVLFIPRVLSVPGTGADTLEDARGLAVDSAFVYVVDAGPAGLQPPANAWFKFARDGTPIASRNGAAFAANASQDVVDDVVSAPPTSPTAPGRLLVAIEHTGILVLDQNGAPLDSTYWSALGLDPSARPTAFAGLALDPVSGDLFLADNDRGQSEVWALLPDSTYVLGMDTNQAWLQDPVLGCNQPLWEGVRPPQFCPTGMGIFGIAYRERDQMVYGVDYGSGTLWRFDPRTGRGARVGETTIPGIWGLAWDSGRDVLYGFQQLTGDGRIWRIEPESASATPLPGTVGHLGNDIAFDPGAAQIYAVEPVGGAGNLIRIDRDSGTGIVVGPTVRLAGLDWDPARSSLVGFGYSDTLWSVDPGSGAAGVRRVEATRTAWEGLAVVGVSAFPNVGVPPARPPWPAALALAASPVPARGPVALRFELPAAARVELAIHDVAGRLVRRLAAGAFSPGPHVIAWDGRDGAGAEAAPGVYFARLAAGGRRAVTRVVRIR